MAIVLASYMGPKRPGEKHADRYSATLRDGRVWFTGGSSSHTVSASTSLKGINAHWRGYCGQGRYQASPKAITRKVWAAALEAAALRKRADVAEILADPVKRRDLMVNTIIATQAREGIETTQEQAEEAYDKIQGEKP